MNQRSRPDDYEAPYPAYSAVFTADTQEYSMALFGLQLHDTAAQTAAQAEALRDGFVALCERDGDGRPLHVESGRQDCDEQGSGNEVVIPYWRDAADQQAFWARDDVQALLDQPPPAAVGWWREAVAGRTSAVDANYSLENVRYGIARHTEREPEQFHAYFGSMRDRVPDFLAGRADGAPGQIDVARREPASTLGQRLKISGFPEKLCVIRGGFGWDQATPKEQEAFKDEMLPVFKAGADYLRDHREDSNCISLRFIREHETGLDSGVQVEVLGWFLTLADLERWTRSHPTHLAIYQGVLKYMAKFQFEPKLNLGHEVAVVDASGIEAEYCNCHAMTGFLPFFAWQRAG